MANQPEVQGDESDEHEGQKARVQTEDPAQERGARSEAVGKEAAERPSQVSPGHEVR